jgi:hypothetical protein
MSHHTLLHVSVGTKRRQALLIAKMKKKIVHISMQLFLQRNLIRFRPFMTVINLTYLLLNYLLTPWSRVLLEKLTGLQLVKKFPAL